MGRVRNMHMWTCTRDTVYKKKKMDKGQLSKTSALKEWGIDNQKSSASCTCKLLKLSIPEGCLGDYQLKAIQKSENKDVWPCYYKSVVFFFFFPFIKYHTYYYYFPMS